MLYELFGIRKNIETYKYLDWIIDQDYDSVLNNMAKIFNLPIKFIPEIFDPIVNDRTKIAEVYIPPGLPTIGSPLLQGYKIRIRLSKSILFHPDVIMLTLAHEISHVFFEVVQYKNKRNEKSVDLCALIFGFRELSQRARKTSYQQSRINQDFRMINTFGYLSDEEYENAVIRINYLLEKHRNQEI